MSGVLPFPEALSKKFAIIISIIAFSFWTIAGFGQTEEDTQAGISRSKSRPSEIIILEKPEYPNPFGGATGGRNPELVVRLINPGCVLVRVFNVRAEPVSENDPGFLEAGEYPLRIDLWDQPRGIYFYQIITMERTQTGMLRWRR